MTLSRAEAQRTVNRFLEHGKAAKADETLISSKNGGSLPKIEVSKLHFFARIIACLRHIPLLGSWSLVQTYAAGLDSLKSGNQQAFNQFMRALRKCYGKRATQIALSSTSLDKEFPLSSRSIKVLNKTASAYFGKGDAINNHRKVTINLWPYESIDRGGHASITVKNKDLSSKKHLSWWPNGTHENKIDAKLQLAKIFDKLTGGHFDISSNFNFKLGGSNESYEEDRSAELSEKTNEALKKGERARGEIKQRIRSKSWPFSQSKGPHPKSPQAANLRKEIDFHRLLEKHSLTEKDRAMHRSLAHDKEILLFSGYAPRSVQKKSKNGEWGVVAQKINFPVAGSNKVTDSSGNTTSTFLLFGLSEKSMTTEIDTVTENYKLHNKAAKTEKRHQQLSEDKKDFQEKREKLRNEVYEIAVLRESLTDATSLLEKIILENQEIVAQSKNKNIKPRPTGRDAYLAGKKIDSAKSALEDIKRKHETLTENFKEAADDLFYYQGGALLQAIEASEKATAHGEEIGYRFASTTNNCASMAIRALRSGGADDFVPYQDISFLGANSPDEKFADYAISVQNELDRWNHRGGAILAQLEVRAPTTDVATPQDLKIFKQILDGSSHRMSSEEREAWNGVYEIFSSNFFTTPKTTSELHSCSKNLVIAAENIFTGDIKDPHHEKLEILLHKMFNLQMQHIELMTT